MKQSEKRLALAFVLSFSAAAVGFACGGDEENKAGGESGAISGGEAQAFFEQKVHQTVADSCGECHRDAKRGAPVFLGANAGASYSAIAGFPGLLTAPNFSPLIQKGIHSGPALTATQNELVTQWLTLEVKSRKLDADPNVPKNLRAAFKQFGDCMDYDEWKRLKLHTIAAVTTEEGATQAGECRSCHNYGQASLWLSGGGDNEASELENAETFLKMRQFPYVQRLVVGQVTVGRTGTEVEVGKLEGVFDGLIPSRRLIDKGIEPRQERANSHPQYALPAELSAALGTYVQGTLAKMNAGACTNITSPDAGIFVEAGAPE